MINVTQATPDPDVIATLLDNEAVLLMGNPHDDTLNATDAFIGQRREPGQTLGQIHAALEEHDVIPDQAAQSLADLHRERLITVNPC